MIGLPSGASGEPQSATSTAGVLHGSRRVGASYWRDWEEYPSGRQFERVTMVQPDGWQFSITRVRDPDGSVEYLVSAKPTNKPGDVIEFSGDTFGRAICAPAEFDSMHAEMMALCARCLE